MTSFNFMRELE